MTDIDLLDLVMLTRPGEDEESVFEEIEGGEVIFKLPSGDVVLEIDDAIRLIVWLRGLATVSKSPLTGKVYRGFGANGMWLTKEEVKVES